MHKSQILTSDSCVDHTWKFAYIAQTSITFEDTFNIGKQYMGTTL